ncbi:NAD(P)-binding domain-containing protein [Nonomuraea cavernae]|uniref:6-phosphogluconate dehydrogenase NADP-binding domain-containing protein n=1 Tax=Nonomuraea cavernae TaxID=2045107 RepID=A0A917YQP1_9ACTN|nr:NAD(P)-binding domain-containing protein [Nonomuraea cavernae]GGO64271.1 hypothetical protein GCM10012289_13300 [Nonomuraea cavernae]
MTIGFVGLGIMGTPMAANLLKAGHAVTGFDLGGERIEHLLARGGTGARSVAEAVADADLVIIMLPDSPQVEEVVPEILEHARPGLLYLDMDYAVDLHYGEGGIDHVKAMEAFGCPARRVELPGDLRDALAWASAESERERLPVLVEVMVEREANAAMGSSLDAIREFEPLPELVAVDWSD